MKILPTILLSLFFISGLSQKTTTIVYDGQGNIISGSFIKTVPPKPVILKDSVLNYTFVLDSSHINVTAYDSSGNILWKTDPYKDKKIQEYRSKRPIIVDIFFCNNQYRDTNKSEKRICITYNNTQFGYIIFQTGEYVPEGQD